MQMALLSVLRLILLCFSQRAPVVTGFSLQSFLSSRSVPQFKRVTTVNNVRNGIRPADPPALSMGQPASNAGPAAVAQMASTWAIPQAISFDASLPVDGTISNGASGAAASTLPAPVTAATAATSSGTGGPNSFFELMTTAPDFTNEYEDSVPGFALTLAERLSMTSAVPMSRFAFYLPDPAGTVEPGYVLFCKSNNTVPIVSAFQARYATASNTSFHCVPEKHTINVSTPTDIDLSSKSSVLLQIAQQASPSSSTSTSLAFEVGVYPPTKVSGDMKPAYEVTDDMLLGSTGGDEPERKLLPNGLWIYKAGPGVKFHGLFPGTAAARPGMAPTLRETSLPLGPNPGGLSIDLPSKAEVQAEKQERETEEKQKERTQRNLKEVDDILHKAAKINREVGSSLEETKISLARASMVHAQVLSSKAYKLPEKLPDGDVFG